MDKRAPELDAAVQAADLAGEAILKIYGGRFESRTKDDDSPVTEADIESNRLIKDALGRTGHAILSEEDMDDGSRLGRDPVWIVDPLDGTSDFVDRTGEFTVMIALVRGGVPELGVIGWPAGGELYAAQAGLGAWRRSDGAWKKIHVTRESDPARCRAVGSRHHPSGPGAEVSRSLGMSTSTVGSSLKVARISSGMAEAYIATTDKMKEWDTAASHCIVHEAGGRMTDLLGRNLSYNREDVFHRDGILVTNGAIHDRVVSELGRLR